MSLERSFSHSRSFFPRWRSVSPHRSSHVLNMARSRSQPRYMNVYIDGQISIVLAHSRPIYSPSPMQVYLMCPRGNILTRVAPSGSQRDIYSTGWYTALKPVIKEIKHQAVDLDVRVTSCDDIYHKGPFFPDVTQSESGVSLGESEDSSLFGGDDDNASQISFGSSSAFHEITIDSELDRLDCEDVLKSPSHWYRSRRAFSPGSDPSSPSPYADSKKRDLMKSPSWENDKTLLKNKMLRVLIPAPDGSLAKERLARRDSGSASKPLAQSSPHASPRSFMGPKLSVAGCWNADDPYDGDESHNDSTSRKIDDSSCYSSLSEDNLSDVSSSKGSSSRKVKLTKKASNIRVKKSISQSLSQSYDPLDSSHAPEESLENIYIPPLESVINGEMVGSKDTEGGVSWWAVYNIGTADARQEERKQQRMSPSEENHTKSKIKIVKPTKTGIPLISAGKHGKEKLKRYSQSSPPPALNVLSPKSNSPSLSDQSDDNLFDDTLEIDKGERQGEEHLKQDCKERMEDVLRETHQNLHLSKKGAFDIVFASVTERDNQKSAPVDALRNGLRSLENNKSITKPEGEISCDEEKGENTFDKGEEPMKDKLATTSMSFGNLPFNINSSLREKGEIRAVGGGQQLSDLDKNNGLSQASPNQIIAETLQSLVALSHPDSQSFHLHPTDHRLESLSKQTPTTRNDIVHEDGDHDSPGEAYYRHDELGNSEVKGQLVELQATFTAPHLPGEVKTQVVDGGIVDVGGSRRCVNTPAIREENSLASYTPGIEEDKNHRSTSQFSTSYSRSQNLTNHADGNNVPLDTEKYVDSTDVRANEFDELCSEFSTFLNISDPDETLVNDGETDLPTDSQTGDGKQNHVSTKAKIEEVDQLSDRDAIFDRLESNETLLARQALESKIIANKIEILSGNVGYDEAKQSDISSWKSSVKPSLDPDQPQAENSMEWRFIDPKLVRASGKSQLEEGRGFEEEAMDDEYDSPFVVRIMATAELTHTQTPETQHLNYSSPIKLFQPEPSHSSQQEHFANTHCQQYNPQLAKELINDNFYYTNQNNVTAETNGDMLFATRHSQENLTENPDLRSIKYEGEEVDLCEEKGIPRDKKNDAQSKDGSCRRGGGEHEFLSGHSFKGPVTQSKSDATSTTLCQQVKHIRRKTVEESVTIECSSASDFCGDHSIYSKINEDCVNCMEIKNRRETVIQEEDEIYTITGPVSSVVSAKFEENVSSEKHSQSIKEPKLYEGDLTHIPHYSTSNQIDSVPQNTKCFPPPIASTETNLPTLSVLPPHPSTRALDSTCDELYESSTMKWRDNSTIPPKHISFDPNFDPSKRVIDTQDNPMVTDSEHGIMRHASTPVTPHSALDQLQSQLSQITAVNVDGPVMTIVAGNIYHDHGEATTHDWTFSNEISDNNKCLNVSPPVCEIEKETGKSRAEIYDNDYDYIISDHPKEQSLNLAPPRQHQLMKSGHNLKASSLWTLQEETDSLLEDFSPLSSPKREFSAVNFEEKKEYLDVARVKQEDNREIISSFLSSLPALGQRTFCLDSSDVDESDGNYSSISTADSFRSSSYGREQTPLSDSDTGVSGDLGADKMDYANHSIQAVASGDDSISSFHDFVSGLESETSTSDQTLSTISNNGINQQGPINFGQPYAPKAYKSSAAPCVTAPEEASSRELFHEDYEEMQYSSIQSFDKSTISSSTFRFKKAFPSTHRFAGLPPFPIDEGSLSSFSTPFTNDETNSETSYVHSEASSRLHVLDLDLSRISSCASPTPSDFSDGSIFTCRGTAEIRKGLSVSFEDDYEMLQSPTRHIPSSTPKPLKSALKKSAYVESNHKHIAQDTAHAIWVKQFDKIIDDFNNKTHRLGSESEVMVMEDKYSARSTLSHGPNHNELYKTFTSEDTEKKQNNVCPVVEDDCMSTFRFKRFLKKSHTKRSRGKRLIRFFSRLSCVSESVTSPDLSATRKMAKLDNGQAYGTDFVPPLPERVHQPLTAKSSTFQSHTVLDHSKDSPTSSNHSLDSCPSRTDSAYSSVSESLSGTFNSPKHPSRLSTNPHDSTTISDSFYLDNVSSSASDNFRCNVTSDPFSPHSPGEKSQEMLNALSDVLTQLDVCGGEIDTALLDRLQHGHQAYQSNRNT